LYFWVPLDSRTRPAGSSAYVFGLDFGVCARTPDCRCHRRALAVGVREAPRHEIAGRKELGFRRRIYGDLRSASVAFREVEATGTLHFDGLIGRGKGAPPALGLGSAWWRRSQDVGAASSIERRRRWLTVSGQERTALMASIVRLRTRPRRRL
jgi:hypothetical protein